MPQISEMSWLIFSFTYFFLFLVLFLMICNLKYQFRTKSHGVLYFSFFV